MNVGENNQLSSFKCRQLLGKLLEVKVNTFKHRNIFSQKCCLL